MNETPFPEPDELLLAPASPAPAPELQATLRRQTTAVVWRRRWRRRLGYAAGLAACYAAGLWTVSLLPSPQTVQVTTLRAALPSVAVAASPLAAEWQALDAPMPRPELFRQAGDRYLAEAGDVASAVRCYRAALHQPAADDMQIASDDNWLLMALKLAKQKERRDANDDG